jgi:predicted helicase
LTTTQYLRAIEKELAAGNATEHTHRTALKSLIESLGDKITATNEPQRIKCGAPDYIITRSHVPLGYIEAKDIGVSLDAAEKSEQLARYRESLGNLILTDYLEFRWYVRPRPTKPNEYPQSEHRLTARLARVDAKRELRVETHGEQEVRELLNAFLNAQVPTVQSPKELAVRMAALAGLIRGTIRRAVGEEGETGALHLQMSGFREVLIHDLTEDQFADMYAQTICYGLFAARCNAKGSEHFTREHAAYDLPKTNPFLRRMFNHIAGPELDERIAWAVDDLAELLHRAEIDAILRDFGTRTRREDPVVHFYETFLASYDSKMREARGVYYTPEPVVSYIVRSIDHILKSDFKLAAGLADSSKIMTKNPEGKGKIAIHKVLILDPATGTGTFLYGVVNHIFDFFRKNLGMWSAYVSEHLLPRLFGFELLMAPYAVAHMKLGLLLDETGYDFQTDERLRVYLTNTLEEAHAVSSLPLFAAEIAREANEASRIKRDLPIMVVLGNPPYSGISVNINEWIESLMEDYKVTVRDEERQIQRLSNDYVKFVRFAQWRLERTGQGIFSDIYVFDLHGVAVRGASRAGTNDQNVFDITQGVTIGIFVKKPKQKNLAKLYYSEIFGTREIKYQTLSANSIVTTSWQTLKPQAPHWYFVPIGSDEAYDAFSSLLSVIGTGNPKADRDKKYGTGVKTRHDDFVIGWSPEDAVEKVRRIAHRTETDTELKEKFRLCKTAHFNIQSARVRAEGTGLEQHVRKIAFRPFDNRYVVYLREFVCEPKVETMKHLLHEDNLALAVLRRDRKESGTGYFVARGLLAKDLVSNIDDALVWPLYLYPSPQKRKNETFDFVSDTRRPNLAPDFLKHFGATLRMAFVPDGKGDLLKTFGPEDILAYMYAVFHSSNYRTRYAEFLKNDYPRVPITSNPELFRKLCGFGSELVDLHLMEQRAATITRYPVAGDNSVESVRYTAPGEGGSEQGRVWINSAQYFEGVVGEVWNFYIGSYQLCLKWLKDRKGRKLTYDELSDYQGIISAVSETNNLISEIDAVIEENGGWPIQ